MMKTAITREQAYALLRKYNQDPFHLRHGRTVEEVMRHFARELGYGEEEEFWGIVGLLHDLDFEMYPEQHCGRRDWRRSSSTPPPATAMGRSATSSQSIRWRRCCLPATS